VALRSQNRFNFFVETDIHKGKSDTGEDVVIIDGIASTSAVSDSDAETLYPTGFNLQPFLESGTVNYNHQGAKDSNAVVGVPLEAKLINGGQDLYVKCMLWPCPQTDGIVRAYENFKKYNLKRTVGFSIEGNATLRGHTDKKHPLYKQILKADVSGLAVTLNPKNKNTLMNIIKGEYTEAYQPLEGETETAGFDISAWVEEYDDWANGDSHRGQEGSVKEFLQNNHEDHMHLLPELMAAINKSMDLPAVGMTVPEDVEHCKKDITKKEFGNIINKSEICLLIKSKYPSLSIAEQLNLLQKIQEFCKSWKAK